jgi:cytochrome o ubiquinol oxidase subunit II
VKLKLVLGIGVAVGLLALVAWWLQGASIAVLEPKGPVAEQQRSLMITATLLSLLVVVPVFALTFGIAWRYRASNTKARYMPEWDHNKLAEAVWWGVPLLLITVLSVIIYTSSHGLDPYRPLVSSVKPLRVQVVALPWKWLFIYPEQRVASVNLLRLPVDTPVAFEITADAPMNSFWIPQLGGQVYAMAGMSTKLHLLASEPGSYRGSSANLSGEGFAGMTFTAQATGRPEFDAWVQDAQRSTMQLDAASYRQLAAPSQNNAVAVYSVRERDLYNDIMMKYTMPDHADMPGMHP